MLKPKTTGRKITCSGCAGTFSRGASRVMRCVLFLFCERCWADRPACERQMDSATSVAL